MRRAFILAGALLAAVASLAAAAQTATISIDSPTITEGNSGTTNLDFTVSLSSASANSVSVNYNVSGAGTATVEGPGGTTTKTDVRIADGSLTFAPGETSKTVTAGVIGDTKDEPDETVVLTLSNALSAIIAAGTGTGTITDDDAAPTLIVTNPTVLEGNSGAVDLTYEIFLFPPSGREVTVSYEDPGTGTATSGTDYTALTAGMLTFAEDERIKYVTVSVLGDTWHETHESVRVRLKDPTNAIIFPSPFPGQGVIVNDDPEVTSITLTVDDDGMGEGDGATTITVTATVDGTTRFVDSRTVRVSVSGSGTEGAVDFAAVTAFDIEIAAGAASGTGTFVLTPTDDSVDETDETVTVSGISGSLTVNSDTITLTDDDAAPTLSIHSPSVSEGNSGSVNLTYTVMLSAASGKEVTVDWAEGTGGTATSGTDYAAIAGGTLTFPAGATSQTFNVSVTGDTVDEEDETIPVSLSDPTNAVVSTVAGTGTGTIADDDAAPTSITLTVDDDGVGEGEGATTITVTATVDGATRFADARTVRVSVSRSGTAGAVDFAPVSAFDIEIAAGAASGAGTFVLMPTDDALDETDETVTVGGASGGLTVNPDTIRLTDDDGAPTSITLTVDDDDVGEDDGATTITVTATVNGATPFAEVRMVRVSVSGSGTAGAVDFAPVTAFDVSIAAGAASGTGTFVLRPTDDAVDETDETVTVGGTSSGLTVNSDTITLTDDDATPTSITLTVDEGAVDEGDGATTITVTAAVDGATRFADDRTVRVSVSGSGTAGAVDFAPVPAFDVSIAAGAASGTGTFVLRPTDDSVDETDETVTIGGTSSGLAVNPDTISLTDDDGVPTSITLTVDDDDVGEGDGTTTITVTATVNGATQFAEDRTVRVSVSGSGTAGAVDFWAQSGFDISLAAGAASGVGTFMLRPTDDAVDETDETVTVNGTSSGLTVNSDTITLTDDDAAPSSITLTVDDDSVGEGEGDGATTITVTAAVDGTTRFADSRTVRVSVSGSGTATAVDFAAVPAFDITIAAGAASGTETFLLRTIDDALDETDETVTVNGAASGLTVNSDTITLTDDDAAPSSITLTVDDDGVDEGDGATTIMVTATVDGARRFADSRTVRVSVSGSGTATAVDFAAVSAFDVSIAAGAASGAGTFVLTPTDDVLDETDETVTVGGTSGGLTVNPDTISLTDDDGAPTSITLTVDEGAVDEGDGATTITVTATVNGATPFADDRTVRVSVSGSGTAGAVDFAPVSAFDVSIAAGATSGTGTFVLRPTDDAVDETDETVTVSGTSSGLTVNSDTIRLTDDDGTPTLTIDSPSVSEGDSGSKDLTFTVTLSAASGKEVTVDWAERTGGTATSRTDYTSVTGGTLAFPAGATSRTFNVSVTGDTVDEADETLLVSLSDPTNATISTATGTGTITDDDGAPTITLTVDDDGVGEGDGTTTITVTATVDGATRFADARTVRVSVSGSGTAGAVDFAPVTAFDIEIAAGAASGLQSFYLRPIDDAVDETDETVTVSGASGGLTVNSDTITLTDDDVAPSSITLTVDDDVVGEGDGATTITVTATVDGATSFADDRTVRVSVSGSGTSGAVDFAAVPAFDVSIAAGAASGSGTFTLRPTGDALDETDETVTVGGTSSGLTVNPDTISLTDDDGVPTSITLTVDDDVVGEADGATTITVTATVNGATQFAEVRTVRVSVSGSGTAGAVDFAPVTAFDVSIAAGAASGTGTFVLRPTGDAVDETDETVTVSGTSSGLTVNSDRIRLEDDDAAPSSITLTVHDDVVGEDDGAPTITVTATVDGATRFADARTVRVSVLGSGMVGAVDFAAVPAFDVEIAAGRRGAPEPSC